jgi:hypothetical protein
MNDKAGQTRQAAVTPFDTAKLDRLMEEAGIDVIVGLHAVSPRCA